MSTSARLSDARSPQNRPWAYVTVSAAFAYAFVWCRIAHPYRLFPTDDVDLLRAMLGEEPLHPAHAALHWLLYGIARIYQLSRPLDFSLLLYTYVVSNSLSGVLISWMIRRTTGSTWCAGLGQACFYLGGWPTTYYFMGYYAPITALFELALFASLLEWALAKNHAWRWAGAAGLLLILCASLAISTWVVLGLACLVALGVAWRRGIATYATFLAPGLLVLTALISTGTLNDIANGQWIYLQENVSRGQDRVQAAVTLFGHLPKPPWLCGFWCLWVYSKCLVLAAVTLMFGVVHSMWKAGGCRHLSTGFAVIVLGLAWAHTVTLDVLPTTKVGRNEFIVFPLVCLFLGAGSSVLVKNRKELDPLDTASNGSGLTGRGRLAGVLVLSTLFAGIAVEGVSMSRAMWLARHGAPRFLEAHLADAEWNVLAADPHRRMLSAWLYEIPVTIPTVPTYAGSKSRVLILGPTGDGSGRSVLKHGCLPEFHFDADGLAVQAGAETRRFPYYHQLAPFCLEEEISQGLLWEGLLPRESDRQHVTLLIWQRSPNPH